MWWVCKTHHVENATVRPPPVRSTATVVVRILPGHRRRGQGSAYLRDELAQAHGFVEHDHYVLDGDTVAYVGLHLPHEA